MEKLLCLLFGHKFKKTAYVNPDYDVYVCERCGKVIYIARAGRGHWHDV